MNTLFKIFIFLGLLMPASYAQTSVGVFGNKDKEAKEAKTYTPILVDSLSAKWWSQVYTDSRPKMKSRLETLRQDLWKKYQTLSKSYRRSSYPYYERIKKMKSLYIKARGKVRGGRPSTISSKDKYTLRDIEDLIQKIRGKRLEIKKLGENLEQEKESTALKGQKYEDLFVTYINSNEREEKIFKGMKVISLKLEIEALRLKNLAQEKEIQERKKFFKNLDEELKNAQGKINVTKSDKQYYLQTARERIAQIKSRKKDIDEIDKLALESTLKGKALKSEYFRQAAKAINAEIAFFSFDHSWSELKMLTAQLELKKENISDQFLKAYKRWKSDKKKAARVISQGEQRSRAEYQRVSEILSNEENQDKRDLLIAQFREIQKQGLYIQKLESHLVNAEIFDKAINQILLKHEGPLKAIAGRIGQNIEGLTQDFWGLFNRSLFTVGETPVTLLGIIRLIIIIFLAFVFAKIVQRSILSLGQAGDGQFESSLYVLARLGHYSVLGLGFFFGLASVGIDLSSVAIVAGALSVGIGFGLQSIFNNFVSGLILLFERPLKVGDYVELESGVRGEVREINVRSTRVTTLDNIDILVPNSEFINGRVINWTLDDAERRVHISFGVAYGSDKDLVKETAIAAAKKVAFTLKHKKIDVWLVGMGDSSLDFELVVWVNHRVARLDRVEVPYLWELETLFREANIEIPFPQRDLHIRSWDTHKVGP